ncbi:MAG: carbohydrate binding domain-containing protein [Planctomycetota bacterium]
MRGFNLAAAILFFSSALSLPARGQDMLKNGGFEPPFSSGIAHDWGDNSYGGFVVRYTEETRNVHSGKSCQKVEALSFTPGSGVQFLQNVDMRAGKTYTLSAWMRGEGLAGPVMILLRRGPSPYDHWVYKWVTVTPEWRKFTVVGTPPGQDPEDNRFYVHFKGTGALWVDDASLREGAFPEEETTPELVQLPPGGPNLLPNASFETGLSGWAPIDRVFPPGIAVDPTTAADGRLSLKARVNPTRISLDEMERTVTSRYLKIGNVPRPFTLSMSLRAAADGARVKMGLYSKGPSIEKTLTLTNEWQRFSVSGLVGGPESMKGSAFVAVTGADGPVDVWIDASQVQEGGLTPFAPASPLEVAGYPTRPDATFLETETPQIDLWWSAPQTPVWSFRVEDFWDREVPAQVAVEDSSDTPPGQTRVAVQMDALGIFRLLATAQAGDATNTAEVVFLRVPLPPATSKMGVHGGTYVPTGQPDQGGHGLFKAFAPFIPDFAQRIGAKWWRLHDASSITDWRRVEPRQGEFDWFDGVVDGLRERGFEILGMLVRTPDWAARDPHNNLNGRGVPRDYREFADYVTKVAEHYKGRIRYWELWNTPGDTGFWSGTPEEYVELLKVGSKALKDVDPENKVTTVWLGYEREDQAANERLLAAGMTNYLDIFGFHGYGGEQALENVERFRAIVAQHGGMKPLWETEAGCYCATFRKSYFDGAEPIGTQWATPQDYRAATAAWVRSVATSFAAGSGKYFFYWVQPTGLFSQQYDAPNLLDYDGTPQPVAAAYAALSRWLSEARPLEILKLTDRINALVFERSEGPLAVIYGLGMPAPDTQTIRLPIAPGKLERIDLMGNRRVLSADTEAVLGVSSEPFYLLAPGVGAQELIAALEAARVEGTPVPDEVLDKLRNYGMDLSHPFFRDHRFVGTILDLADVSAYRFAKDDFDVLVLWFGDARGVVRDLPKKRLMVLSLKDQLKATDALGRKVNLSGAASRTSLDLSLVPVFLVCPKDTRLTLAPPLP